MCFFNFFYKLTPKSKLDSFHPVVYTYVTMYVVLIKPSLHNTYNNSCNYYNYSSKQHVSALFGHHQAYKPDDGRIRPKHVAYLSSCNNCNCYCMCCVKTV